MGRLQRFALCSAVLLSWVVNVGSTVRAGAPQGLTVTERKQMLAEGKICTLPTDAAYSLGALVIYEGQRYRCTKVFGENMKPAGSGWVLAEPPSAER